MNRLGLLLIVAAATACATVADPGAGWACGIAQNPTGDLEGDFAGHWLEESEATATAWEIRADGSAVSDYFNRATGTRAEQAWNWFLEDDTTIRFSGTDAEALLLMELTEDGWRRSGADSWQRCLPS